MNWPAWQLKFESHICRDLVQNPQGQAANWLGDSFGVQQELANNEDLADILSGQDALEEPTTSLELCPQLTQRIYDLDRNNH
jgi:hypothetical protein